jgi:hypothetical protein
MTARPPVKGTSAPLASTALMNMVGVSATMITLFYVGYKIGKETPHDN